MGDQGVLLHPFPDPYSDISNASDCDRPVTSVCSLMRIISLEISFRGGLKSSIYTHH